MYVDLDAVGGGQAPADIGAGRIAKLGSHASLLA